MVDQYFPTAIEFWPQSGPVGTAVTIKPAIANCQILFNGTQAIDVEFTGGIDKNGNQQLWLMSARVPVGATTGSITIKQGDNQVTSDQTPMFVWDPANPTTVSVFTVTG